jgi:tetratricopeptide (TPR) repeat protein
MNSDNGATGFLGKVARWFVPPSVADLINDGNARYARKDFDGAIADYTQSIRLDPRNSHAYSNRGAAWYAKQEYDQSIADFTEAIQLDPGCLYAYQGRGCAWLAKLDFNRAIADLTAALDLDPRDAISYVNRANAWHRLQNFDRALDDCNDAIRYDPNSAYAFCVRACVWLAKQEQDRSVDGAFQLDRPILRSPAGSNARRGYDKAFDDFYEAIRLDPNYAWGYCGRGATWHCLEEYDKAIADYTEAIRLDPAFVLAYTNRGHAFREKQAYRPAIADFEEAIRIAPNDVWSINGLAWLLGSALDAEVRDGKRAVELARKAFALDWTFPAAWLDTMAVAHAEAGNFAEAIRCEEQALQSAPAAFVAEMRERLDLFRSNQPYRQQKKRLPVTQFMPAKVR